MLMRGGTSRGPFFLADDLPAGCRCARPRAAGRAGFARSRQIDGLGGAHPLTSKAGIVRRSHAGWIWISCSRSCSRIGPVDTTPNCGNMLAAVLPFALERPAAVPTTTTARILTLNTGMQCDVTVQTPGGSLQYGATPASTACPDRRRQSASTSSTRPVPYARRCCPPAACWTASLRRPRRESARAPR
jgi:4-oxalomesaconate tautomerase